MDDGGAAEDDAPCCEDGAATTACLSLLDEGPDELAGGLCCWPCTPGAISVQSQRRVRKTLDALMPLRPLQGTTRQRWPMLALPEERDTRKELGGHHSATMQCSWP